MSVLGGDAGLMSGHAAEGLYSRCAVVYLVKTPRWHDVRTEAGHPAFLEFAPTLFVWARGHYDALAELEKREDFGFQDVLAGAGRLDLKSPVDKQHHVFETRRIIVSKCSEWNDFGSCTSDEDDGIVEDPRAGLTAGQPLREIKPKKQRFAYESGR